MHKNVYDIIEMISENLNLRHMLVDISAHAQMERDEGIKTFLKRQIGLHANEILKRISQLKDKEASLEDLVEDIIESTGIPRDILMGTESGPKQERESTDE